LAQEHLKKCIETIEERGLYKPPKKNFLRSLDDKSLATWIFGIGGAIFYAGLWMGNHNCDAKINKLEQNVQNMIDVISKSRLERKSSFLQTKDTIHFKKR